MMISLEAEALYHLSILCNDADAKSQLLCLDTSSTTGASVESSGTA